MIGLCLEFLSFNFKYFTRAVYLVCDDGLNGLTWTIILLEANFRKELARACVLFGLARDVAWASHKLNRVGLFKHLLAMDATEAIHLRS